MNAVLNTNQPVRLWRYLPASLALVALTLVSSVAHASANLLTNGSFETPLVPVGGFTNYPSGSTAITGWTVVGPEVSVVNTSFVSECCKFPAADGSQWLDLTGDVSNSLEGVEQSVATVAGKTYDLSFAVGNVFDPRGVYGTTSAVGVMVNGASLGTFTNSCTTCTNTLTWQTFTTSFMATGSTTMVEFLNKDPATDNSNGLDNVVLTGAAGPAVPEPATLGLFSLGLAGVGLFRRRRQR
jgi:choice-of-anchor C domain-containing protein